MCTVYNIDTILDTDLLLTKNKFNRMTLTKENDNFALGRTVYEQDRANIMLPFLVVHRWQHVSYT